MWSSDLLDLREWSATSEPHIVYYQNWLVSVADFMCFVWFVKQSDDFVVKILIFSWRTSQVQQDFFFREKTYFVLDYIK